MKSKTSVNRPFIKGLKLSELFYEETVEPILTTYFPNLTYSAALLGRGSEVLGFDTPQSMDHDWGPRLMLFLAEADYETYWDKINQVLRQELPSEIHSYPTNFDYHEDGATMMVATPGQSINHGVMFLTVRRFCNYVLNIDPDQKLKAIDWVTIPEQILRAITGGRIFHDGLDQLGLLQAKLHYYPHEVWLYLLANQWRRISQEEAFMGRCGQVGDELGSRLVAARLVRDLMKLCFLMEQQYAPFIKWFGTAFAQLDCAEQLSPIFTRVLNATWWQERETHLTTAYELVTKLHNDLGITTPQPTQVSRFHNRPFLVIHAQNFADAIHATIISEEAQALPPYLGSIDQFADSTDIFDNPARFNQLKLMYHQGDS